VVRSLHLPSAPGSLWSCADCDLCRGGAHGFCHGSGICDANHHANSNLDSHTGSNRDSDSDCDANADTYVNSEPYAYGYAVAYAYRDANAEQYADSSAGFRQHRFTFSPRVGHATHLV